MIDYTVQQILDNKNIQEQKQWSFCQFWGAEPEYELLFADQIRGDMTERANELVKAILAR